ncbi:MAG: protein kinase [Gemmataceae bacterium]|nr:protein kinase [Gemmataceae bacterium]MCI0737866.1 protein kinase [Gemmataceae bacterium]
MAEMDASALADLAVRAGVLTPHQVQEAWMELGQRGGDVEPFLRFMERKVYLTPWQSDKLQKQHMDGYFLGGYRILYKIASGSFGRVYRADDARTGRTVAIKVLRRKWSEDKHSIELFEREGRVGMQLRHPNIVEILTIDRDLVSKQYYIVMEFVEGSNLRDFLSIRKKLEPAEALRFLEEITAGLQYALSKGLTHRDMKLTNILITSQGGTAKLVDFGLAGVYGTRDAEGVHIDRTVDYAGLEKTTNVAQGDTRSDLFFLGCVVYHMLTGRPPMELTRNPRDRMNRERFINIEPIQASEVNGPPSVIRLVNTMMSLNPMERFQTPSQLLDAIREVRQEVDGLTNKEKKSGPRTLFLVEKDERLQNVLRDKFKEQGFRVLLSVDPQRALDRFRTQPFDYLIVDAGTTGEESVMIFERIMLDAQKLRVACGGVLMLNEDQNDLMRRVAERPNQAVLVQPIKFKQLLRALQEFKAE